MKYLPIVLRNVVRNRRRFALTVLSISVSVFIFAALMSLPGVVNQILRDQAGSLRLVCHSKAGFLYSLPTAYRDRIAAVAHVEAVLGESIFLGTYRDPQDLIMSLAVDPERVEDMWPDWSISQSEAEQFRRVRSGALVGTTLLKRFHWKVGDKIILRGTIYPLDPELSIVGTLQGTVPAFALFFRRDHLDEMLGRPGTVNLFWIKVDKSQSIPGVIAEVDRKFANSPAETATETELGISQNQIGPMRLLFDGAKVLAAIVTVAIALVAANTAAMSVRERRKEIAVMRAIGFRRGVILVCLLGEGLLIGLSSGLLGCAAAYVGLKFLPYASRSLGPLAFIIRLPMPVLAESLAVAAVIGIGSSLAPALAAVRREVAGELRAV